ncbi:MAG: hypothetical protein KAU62_16250 [Candidatus Heimdallarchaeota archaeon]|nr:hypothetical protein [Candidatus Heimdallarchaeota archaeon]MCG3257657.1 hypothetical protein [Candidatus Heimdallarchaeota archaeon]MCK4612709.1 hypothetical protein [Candidatus Heimdallarchaeota archaeon]
MKRTKIKLTIVMVLGLLVLTSISKTNTVQGQEYSYPSELTVGASYEWEVVELSTLGSVNTNFLNFGDDTLKKGDKFSITLLDSINNVTNGTTSELLDPENIWAEFYLNGEFKTNETDQIGLLDLNWLGLMSIGMDDFFLQPTTYENVTGVYNYFEILNAEFPQVTATIEEELSSHGYLNKYFAKISQSSKLSSKVWTVKLQVEEKETEDDLVDPEDWEKTYETINRYIEIRFNVKTGLLTYVDYDYAFHRERTVEGSLDITDNSINLLIKSTTLPIGAPFDWAYSVIGLALVSLIVYKRKRR